MTDAKGDVKSTEICEIMGKASLILETLRITVERLSEVGGAAQPLFKREVRASLAGQERLVHYLSLGISKPNRRNRRVKRVANTAE